MSGHNKGIFDLGKWNSQTLESVRHQLDKADAPCVGFSMVYMDFINQEDIVWKFKTFLAFDPNNPVPAEDRKKLERIFEGYAVLVEKIMNGGEKKH
jgi:hypothetical protein